MYGSIPEVNVQTGRKGYFKRVQASEKAVEENAEVYSGDLSIADDAADRHYSMAAKQILPTSGETIDVGSLMFFQSSMFAAPTSSNQLQLTDIASNQKSGTSQNSTSAGCTSQIKTELGAETSDDDASVESVGNVLSNPLSHVKFALPKAKVTSLAKAAAKTSAAKTVSAKSSGNPKAKAAATSGGTSGRGKKRKTDQDDENKIHTLTFETEEKVPKGGDLTEGDSQIVRELGQKMDDKKANLFKDILDGDSGTQDGLKSGQKDLISFNQQIKQKIKSLGRRKESSQAVTEKLEPFVEEVTNVCSVIAALIQSHGTDHDNFDFLKGFESNGWIFSSAVWKRAVKCSVLSHLKYGKWEMFTTDLRARILDHFGNDAGHAFFHLNLNDMIQRLLRVVSNNKASYLSTSSWALFSLCWHIAD